jgi:hypothetical protein
MLCCAGAAGVHRCRPCSGGGESAAQHGGTQPAQQRPRRWARLHTQLLQHWLLHLISYCMHPAFMQLLCGSMWCVRPAADYGSSCLLAADAAAAGLEDVLKPDQG